MRNNRMKLALVLIIIASTSVVVADTHWVRTAAEFNALPPLNAGDEVVLQDGNYSALNKTLVSAIADDDTAMQNPVRVYAQTPGGVKITEPSNLNLSGRGITLAGLDFVAGSGMIENNNSSPAHLICLAAHSRYMTVTNLRFKNCTAGHNYGYWLAISGFNHVIEYCSFEGKDEPNANTTIAVRRDLTEAGASTPRHHIIRRCYFGPRLISKNDNGYETIRIGDSSSQVYDMRVVVEENVFYRTVWRNDGKSGNDTEIISNKTAGNVIRNNTFLESYGQLTLRHGDRALVEGNYFLGGGQYVGSAIVIGAANAYQGGVRIIGEDHVVRNNYFENLQGIRYRAALTLMGGSADFDHGDGSYGDNGYEAAHGAQIYHNTFVGCKEINLGFLGRSEHSQPQGCTFTNNVWQGIGSPAAIERHDDFKVGKSGGNYIYEPNGTYGWEGLTNGIYSSSVSPAVTEPFDFYRIPEANSPLLDVALSTGMDINDVRGLPRTNVATDIGCFERELVGTCNAPLLRSEVGPLFDGGPAGTYPVTGLDPDLPPSGNFDMSQWYLQLPVDTQNGFTGEAAIIPTAVLANAYQKPPYFYTDTKGAMVFMVPFNGAVRGSSPKPRCELRETYANGSLQNWKPLDDGGVHIMDAVCTVEAIGNNSGG
ncbi:chondroitinase-B domain-containing protein, partial [Planctomycetota bacterium]